MEKNSGINNGKRWLSFLFFLFVLILILVPTVSSIPSCSYGVFDVWMSIDGTTWLNTTVNNISLKRGQPFYVKAMIKPTQNHIWLALYLFEVGTRTTDEVSFKVINGPCGFNDGCDFGEHMINEKKEVIWKLQVKKDPKWIEGFTPLSITAFFQKKNSGLWKTEDISFSIAYIYLDEATWVDSTSSTEMSESIKVIHHEKIDIHPIGCLLLIITGLAIYQKKKK